MLLDWRLYVIAGAVVAGWFWHTSAVKTARDEGHRAGYAQAQDEARKAAAELSKRLQKEKDDAVAKAEQLRRKAQADAMAAAVANERLRGLLADVERRIATASDAAVREYAIAANDVFEQCVNQYRSVAEKADGHANDVRLILEAWPKQ